jgi:dihydroorotase
LITNGRVLNPSTRLEADANVLIVGDRIEKIGSPASVGARALELQRVTGEDIEELSARGLVVAPGFVDVHVHFRDPGLTYKEDIHTMP